MDHQIELHSKESPLLEDISIYRRLIGQLIYLTSTRPNICFVVNHLSQFLPAPTIVHYQAILKILRYLKANPGQGGRVILLYNWKVFVTQTRQHALKLAVLLPTFAFLGDSLISWQSKKQHTISWSFFEAEYRALASTTCEIQWFSYLLRNLYIVPQATAVLFLWQQVCLTFSCQSCVSWAWKTHWNRLSCG